MRINQRFFRSLFYALVFFILTPVILMVFIFVFLFMGRPIFFKQIRIGINRRPFIIYKFRTMKDGQVTILGSILRSSGWDELPQLINLIKGDMNLIGPRPLTKSDIYRLKWDSSLYDDRWSIHPGIIGLAQFSHRCHPKINMFYDLYYIKNQSICLKFKIVLWSFLVPFLGKKTVKKLIHKRKFSS